VPTRQDRLPTPAYQKVGGHTGRGATRLSPSPAEFHGGQKGSIENASGIIRWYLPKKFDPAGLTQLQLDCIGTEKGVRQRDSMIHD
jgi:hypothetical protein